MPRAKVGLAIIAPKFCTIIGTVLDSIYSLIVEFDVMHNSRGNKWQDERDRSPGDAELGGRIASEPHTRLRYFCSPYHQDSALYPFIIQLERAAGFTRDDTGEGKLDKLRALLAPGARNDGEFELLAELLSLPSSAASSTSARSASVKCCSKRCCISSPPWRRADPF